jgi:hypothetical protein
MKGEFYQQGGQKFPNYSERYIKENLSELSNGDKCLYGTGIAIMLCGGFGVMGFATSAVAVTLGYISESVLSTGVAFVGTALSGGAGTLGYFCHQDAFLGNNKNAARAFRGEMVQDFDYLPGGDHVITNFANAVAKQGDVTKEAIAKTVALGVLMHLGINDPRDIQKLDTKKWGAVIGGIAKELKGAIDVGVRFNVYNEGNEQHNQRVLENKLTPEVLEDLRKTKNFANQLESYGSGQKTFAEIEKQRKSNSMETTYV